jgi:class 3 adenylate cyclase
MVPSPRYSVAPFYSFVTVPAHRAPSFSERNCAIEVQRAMVERNVEVALDKRIEFRIGIHLGDVVEESDGDRRVRC